MRGFLSFPLEIDYRWAGIILGFMPIRVDDAVPINVLGKSRLDGFAMEQQYIIFLFLSHRPLGCSVLASLPSKKPSLTHLRLQNLNDVLLLIIWRMLAKINDRRE